MSNRDATVESVIRVASRLIAVLEQEVELLRTMKVSALGQIQEEKMRLVASYEEQVSALAAAPDTLRRIAPALQEEFAEIAERFDVAMTENRRALTAANEAQNRFMQSVVKAAEEKRASVQTYAADGGLPPAYATKTGSRPLSLTLDRQL